MLAAPVNSEADLARLRYPLLVSPKLDGIRLRIDPILGAVSRTHKPIPNQHIQQALLGQRQLHHLDGEIIVGEPTSPNVFNLTQSAVMTQGGTPTFSYYIFDHWADPRLPYRDRLTFVDLVANANTNTNTSTIDLIRVPQDEANNPQDVLTLEQMYVEAGYEGIILRDPQAPYKSNRSTFKEQYLLKFKRVEDAEATIVGFEPLQRNNNPATKDVFGLTKRTSHSANKVDDNLLGNLIVSHPDYGTFSIGSGFDVPTREHIWANQSTLIGATISFKYQKAGLLNKPRFPIFKGIRHD